MSTKIKKAKPAAPAIPTAIPTAIREKGTGMPKDTKKTGGYKGLAGKLAGLGKKEGTKSSVKDKDRPVMILPAVAQEQFRRVAPAKILLGYLESYVKTERSQLDKMLRDEFLATMWKSRTKPQNPKLVINGENGKPDATALFALVAKWHIEEIKTRRDEGPEETFVRTLVEVVGLKESKARALVETELDFTPEILINLTNLESSDEEMDRSAAKKLTDYLAGDSDHPSLTDEEKAALITVRAKVKVLDGFLDRLCGYCANVEQVDSILTTLIKPEWHLKSVKYGVSDPEGKRLERLLDECREIIEGAENGDDE